MNYLTIDEVNSFLGTSGEDSLLTTLGDMAESSLHTELRITSFSSGTYNEYHQPKYDFFIMKELNPTSVTHINDIAIDSSKYLLTGRRLDLKDTYTLDSWNRLKITYIAGYTTIPQDVKTLCLYMISGLYNSRKGVGIKQFTQGQLSITYSSQQEMDTFKAMFNSTLSKYRKNDILC